MPPLQPNSTSSRYGSAISGFAAIAAASCFAGGTHSSAGAAEARFLQQLYQYARRAPSSTHMLDVDANEVVIDDQIVFVGRETSEQEHLIAKLREWEWLGPNWDGENAAAPVTSSLQAANQFVCLLDRDAEMPEPMLHASGRAGLVWSNDDRYLELEFLLNGSVAYFCTAAVDKHKGVVAFDGRRLPPALVPLIPT